MNATSPGDWSDAELVRVWSAVRSWVTNENRKKRSDHEQRALAMSLEILDKFSAPESTPTQAAMLRPHAQDLAGAKALINSEMTDESLVLIIISKIAEAVDPTAYVHLLRAKGRPQIPDLRI